MSISRISFFLKRANHVVSPWGRWRCELCSEGKLYHPSELRCWLLEYCQTVASRGEGERRRAQEYPLATPAPPARDRGPQILFRERLKNNHRYNFGKNSFSYLQTCEWQFKKTMNTSRELLNSGVISFFNDFQKCLFRCWSTEFSNILLKSVMW